MPRSIRSVLSIMNPKKPRSNQDNYLRSKAEEQLEQSGADIAAPPDAMDEKHLFHELQVHQLELQMQNEELSRAKQEAEEALAKYSDLYEFAPIGLFTIDGYGQILEVNLTGATLLNVERHTLLKRRFELYVVPKDRPILKHLCQQAFSTGLKQSCELRLATSSSSEVHARVDGTATENSKLNEKRFRLAVMDITERKKVEEALKQSAEDYRYLVEHAPTGIYELDYAGSRFRRVNDAICNVLGYSREELLVMNPMDLLDAESQQRFRVRIKKVLAGEPIDESVSYRVFAKDGREIWAVLKVKLMHTEGGGLDGALVIAHDVTERKRMEEALREAKDDLEHKVEERTHELQEALQAAEESARAKAAFMANMSHELRTPLNAVIGFTGILLDEPLAPEHRDYIEGIRNGGEALLALVNDILDFSRVDKEKVVLEHRPLSLKNCVEESLDMVAIQADQKGLKLSYAISYGTPDTIIGDHGRLRQILVNLLGNAVKFTDKGEIKVSISAQGFEGNKCQIHFSVSDTGIGIPQDKIIHAFEPFAQVECVISRKRDGVGLGLAISKKLVELMVGKIWAESIPGQGSTFHFTIPTEAVLEEQIHPEPYREDASASVQNFNGLKTMSILVAEDDPLSQKVLMRMLKRLGYRSDAVADGKEVLQVLKLRPYDLILMDVKMPEMDGITATKEIRRQWPRNGLKIIAVTAYALEGDRERCLEAGMDDYISKPVQMEELVKTLKKYSVKSQ